MFTHSQVCNCKKNRWHGVIDYPGHTLFPLLATLLSNGATGDALLTDLEATGRDPWTPSR